MGFEWFLLGLNFKCVLKSNLGKSDLGISYFAPTAKLCYGVFSPD